VDTPEIDGLGHIDLTVTDGEQSAKWWHEVMGFIQVDLTEKDAWTTWHMAHPSSLVVSLMAHRSRASERFDEHAIGLDHLALRVKDRATLEEWAKHLDRLGVVHSGVQEEHEGHLIVLRDPDNIQLEVWAPGSKFDEGLERLRSQLNEPRTLG
jgi:catechol-2,3-dioxygenase